MPWIDKLFKAAASGKAADFTEDRRDFEEGRSSEPILDAGELRRLILALKRPTDPIDYHPAECLHWKIRGLRVSGRLNLCDGRLPGGNRLPAIEFIECRFDDGICADGADIQRLHISDCTLGSVDQTLPQLSLVHVHIENDLRLCRLRPDVRAGLLRVDASSARIGASLILERFELRALPRQSMMDPLATPFALNLRNATVRGDVLLQPELAIHGGLMAVGLQIGGDFSGQGLLVDDGEEPSFRQEAFRSKSFLRSALALDNARIQGNVYLVTRDDQQVCRIIGEVSMQGTHIEGMLSSGVYRSNPAQRR